MPSADNENDAGGGIMDSIATLVNGQLPEVSEWFPELIKFVPANVQRS
jgi:hypothetical protein